MKKIRKGKGVLQTLNNSLVKTDKGDITSSLFFPKASLTIEASIALPLFLLFCLTILSFISVIQTTMQNQGAVHKLLRTAAVCGGAVPGQVSDQAGDCITLDYLYPVSLPVGGFFFKTVYVRQRSKVHIFNGYDDSNGDWLPGVECFVYISKYGDVYHKKSSCSALQIHIKEISGKTVSSQRNLEGKKYHKCKKCTRGYRQEDLNIRTLYITGYGTKYHASCACSELKRTVYLVEKSKVNGKRACKICD